MKKRIMLVEDDHDACLLFRHILSNAGYEVEHGLEGHSILTDNHSPADLYILDNSIPTIDGIALTKFLKLKEKTRENPVLIISGNPGICNKAKLAGASAFIGKPFDVNLFLQTVHDLIYNRNFKKFDLYELNVQI